MNNSRNTECQLTSRVLLIRPKRFGFNPQTAESNTFQQHDTAISAQEIERRAIAEFDTVVQTLRAQNIHVIEIPDTEEPHTPDSIFPNNWFSTHANGRLVLYPMLAENRRLERREDIIRLLRLQYRYDIVVDLTAAEQYNRIVEGTGSLVLDREHKKAYCALSDRSDKLLAEQWAEIMGYELISFATGNDTTTPVYHTNVIMAIGEKTAVFCSDICTHKHEAELVIQHLQADNHNVVSISVEQMNSFAGNMLQVQTFEGEKRWLLSQAAFNSLSQEQKTILEQDAPLVPIAIPTIETFGGGSLRCMIAEIFPSAFLQENQL